MHLPDRAGFLWVGTENGLFRYEGRKFHAYDRKDGLPSTSVSTLAESPDGVLWAGFQPGLARRVGDRFEPVDLGVPVSVVSAIRFDRAGRMYVNTKEALVVATPAGNGFQVQMIMKGRITGLDHRCGWQRMVRTRQGVVSPGIRTDARRGCAVGTAVR